MPPVSVRTPSDRRPTYCMDLVIASVESFSGAPEAGDILMLLSRDSARASRFGQAVFLREEVDGRTIHGLFPVGIGGLEPLITKLAGESPVRLRTDDGFWLSGVPARADVIDDTVLVAVDPGAAVDLAASAGDRGLELSRVGAFRIGADHGHERPPRPATDCVQSAFWARRRFWWDSELA